MQATYGQPGQYLASTPTLNANDRVGFLMDINNKLITNPGALSSSVDSVTTAPGGLLYVTITTATTTVIPNVAAIGDIQILGGTLGTVTVYDNSAASGPTIVPTITPLQNQHMAQGVVPTSGGITIVTGSATVILVTYHS